VCVRVVILLPCILSFSFMHLYHEFTPTCLKSEHKNELLEKIAHT
jgi:hypothetical protein